jgi:hypothetical protein
MLRENDFDFTKFIMGKVMRIFEKRTEKPFITACCAISYPPIRTSHPNNAHSLRFSRNFQSYNSGSSFSESHEKAPLIATKTNDCNTTDYGQNLKKNKKKLYLVILRIN